jgi:hypothetical protein
MLFVESLKDHRLALEIVRSLTDMVEGYEMEAGVFIEKR